ncbi:MAG: 2-C-methyl-D-erythritol 4-phosphate cytidylyltransferase [bacterium]|nr:2-C-methyl-D-erythritol 4-phosphate cytidylyltransferase [bacterium]
MSTTALIVAAGQSTRFGGEIPKQFVTVCGRPLLAWTISRFEAASSIDKIIVVVSSDYLMFTGDNVIDPFRFEKVYKIVSGGETRQESVLLGLQSMPANTEFVAIHDGARPLVLPSDIDLTVEMAREHEAAMLATAVTDTVKRVEDSVVVATLDRRKLFLAQTPQVFRYETIIAAHQEHQTSVTDDASLVEMRGVEVHVVPPHSSNLKVTTPDDLLMVEVLIEQEMYEQD